MKKTKKVLASLAIAGMALTMVPFNAFAETKIPTRLAGVTAEQTAVIIADQTGWTGTAILASSTSYGKVDALTASPLAASLKAPILLNGAGNTLNADTKAELTKLEVKTVYVTSGTAVIKQGVLDELKGMGIKVIALGGIDRAATSVNIASKMVGVTKIAVANGLQDALSIAAIAAAANEPILLTEKNALPASVKSYLAANPGITASDIIGGTGIISEAVKATLPSATRHAGNTAYDTNNQVIQDFASSLKFDNIFVANGVTGIDALAGAPLAAITKSPIVLMDGINVPTAAFIYTKTTNGSVITALGGTAVVPEGVFARIAYNITTVTFQDENLEKTVRATINKPTGDILKSDVEKVTELKCWGKISNLSGLENLTNLTDLSLNAGYGDDMPAAVDLNISPLKGLTNLTNLGLSYNQITNIDALKGLTKLTDLFLEHNLITDYTPVSSYYKNLTLKDFTID